MTNHRVEAVKWLAISVLFVLVLFCMATCTVKQSDFEALKSENDSLVQQLEKERHNVTISNSIVTQLTSKFTGETYDIYISLPVNYKNSEKKYAVLVALDAEVNFGAVTYISQRLTKDELIPELCVVGIAYRGNTDEDTYYSLRSKDFTPTVDKEQEARHKNKFMSGTGGAEHFAKFLSDELFPFLANHYPVSEDRTIYGHSFGGLFGTYVLLHQPGLFNKYLLLSPSLWWDEKVIVKSLAQHPFVLAQQTRIYLGTGALEDTMVDDHLEFARLLQRSNAGSSNIKSEILDDETHRTIFGRGFTNGLRFVYKKN